MTSTDKLNKIAIGMTKEEVLAVIGEPVTKAAQSGLEVYSYHLSTPEQMTLTGGHDIYFIKFVSGRVESFGQKGDFNSTKDPTSKVVVESTVHADSKVKVNESSDLYTELKKLDELKKAGIITSAEFEAQKQKLLSR